MTRLGIRENLTEEDKLPEKPKDVEWKALFRLSELHSLAAVTFRALQTSGLRPDEETFAAWKKAAEICVLADTQQLFAWEELKDLCAEKGFRFLPLKGLRLKYLYPEASLRLMGDLDILYEKIDFRSLKRRWKSSVIPFKNPVWAEIIRFLSARPSPMWKCTEICCLRFLRS